MGNSEKIKQCMKYLKVSQDELATKIDTSKSALNQRLKTDKFSSAELEKIAKALDCEYISYFEFPDGTRF